MKNKIIQNLFQCVVLMLASTALGDNAPLWLDPTNTVIAPAGTQVLLRAVADATPPPSYYWLSNSIPVPNATTNCIVVTAAASTETAKWSIVAVNYMGASTNGPYYVLVPTGSQTYYPWGNATLSGTNSILDVLKIGDYISGTATAGGTSYWLADVNQDGLVNAIDQNLVESAVLGRISLTNINSLVIADSNGSGMPNWMRWKLGLYQDVASTDATGIPDAIVLANGDDPLDPRNVPPFGMYAATPVVTIINLTPAPATVGTFVATPPLQILISK